MEEPAPKIDPRSAQDISRQLRKLLGAYAPQWKEQGPASSPALSDALIGIFSRFSEIVIQRLNKTPEKNLLAYLDMLGLSVLPPHPARAPLTFFLTAGSLTDAVVPAGTQVAAKPAEGDAGPVVFETERELTVVAARLDAAITRDPSRDAYADRSAVIYAPSASGAQIFVAETPIEHILYISHERFLAHPALKELRIGFQLKQAITNPAARRVAWELCDETRRAEIPSKPAGAGATPGPNGFVEDGTAALTTTGDVVFTRLPVVQPASVGGFRGRRRPCPPATPT